MLEQQCGTKARQELGGLEFTGTHKYYCAPHEDGMFGTFTVR